MFFPKTRLPPAGAASFLSLHSVRNMAFHRRDSSQMAVVKPHRWSYLRHGSRRPNIGATQMVQSTSRVSNGGVAPLTDQREAESKAKVANGSI